MCVGITAIFDFGWGAAVSSVPSWLYLADIAIGWELRTNDALVSFDE